jgi:hypothetical protein
LHARKARCGGLFKRRRCGGDAMACGGHKHEATCGCSGGGKVMMDAPVKGGGDMAPTPPPAPTVEQGATYQRSGLIFRRVSFRR